MDAVAVAEPSDGDNGGAVGFFSKLLNVDVASTPELEEYLSAGFSKDLSCSVCDLDSLTSMTVTKCEADFEGVSAISLVAIDAASSLMH